MKIQVVENVLKANDAIANDNRAKMAPHNILCINIMSAPGSGKTTMLQKTIPALKDELKFAVLVGDLQTTRDAERLDNLGAQVVQINTGRGCHLDPTQVTQGLESLDLSQVDILFIENVGNMVCPASFDLGEHKSVVLLSIPEGEDKIAKYPTLFQKADAVLLTKIDLEGILPFNKDVVYDDMKKINSAIPLLELSTKSGDGFEGWLNWLRETYKELKS
jgi:hydrogenase nickel incorporation protein HypB